MSGERGQGAAIENFVLGLLAHVLEIEVSDLDIDASITSTAGWDSFSHAELCERISQILGEEISDGLIEACSSAKGLVATFEARSDINLSEWTNFE